MTRDEAVTLFIENETKLPLEKSSVVEIVHKIYDDFEQGLGIETSDKTCAGCIHKPKDGENYLDVCGTCSRFYGDGYERV